LNAIAKGCFTGLAMPATARCTDAAFDVLAGGVGMVLTADRTLGGLCDWVEAEAPRPVDLPVAGAASLKAAVTGSTYQGLGDRRWRRGGADRRRRAPTNRGKEQAPRTEASVWRDLATGVLVTARLRGRRIGTLYRTLGGVQSATNIVMVNSAHAAVRRRSASTDAALGAATDVLLLFSP
jgi:hypothetical protein